MAGLGSLARGLKSVVNTRRSYLYLTELDSSDGVAVVNGVPSFRRLQYFPETLQDSKAVSYQSKDVPGGSLPLYQWVSSGERTISFTTVFSTDVDHAIGDQSTGARTRVERMKARTDAAGVSDKNVFIPAAVAWLRRFMLPRYGETSEVGVPLTEAPHKILLGVPGSYIGWNGGAGTFGSAHAVLCLMTQCEVTYESLFPSGNPRLVTVQLAFAQIAQSGGRVRFPGVTAGFDEQVANLYALGGHTETGGGNE